MTSPQAARVNVYLRDRGVCAATEEFCGIEPYGSPHMLKGKQWQKWCRGRHLTGAEFFADWTAEQIAELFFDHLRRGRVMGININLGTWEVDHIVPLWKVAAIPRERQAKYFTMANMQTLSVAAHQRKSADEAAERAHYERLERQHRGQPKHQRAMRRRMDGSIERQAELPW